jgi:hypothetical protein
MRYDFLTHYAGQCCPLHLALADIAYNRWYTLAQEITAKNSSKNAR